MLKVIKMQTTSQHENSYRVTIFADTKDEVIDDAEIEGFPENGIIEMGSCVITADADVAFRKSDGIWNWV